MSPSTSRPAKDGASTLAARGPPAFVRDKSHQIYERTDHFEAHEHRRAEDEGHHRERRLKSHRDNDNDNNNYEVRPHRTVPPRRHRREVEEVDHGRRRPDPRRRGAGTGTGTGTRDERRQPHDASGHGGDGGKAESAGRNQHQQQHQQHQQSSQKGKKKPVSGKKWEYVMVRPGRSKRNKLPGRFVLTCVEQPPSLFERVKSSFTSLVTGRQQHRTSIDGHGGSSLHSRKSTRRQRQSSGAGRPKGAASLRDSISLSRKYPNPADAATARKVRDELRRLNLGQEAEGDGDDEDGDGDGEEVRTVPHRPQHGPRVEQPPRQPAVKSFCAAVESEEVVSPPVSLPDSPTIMQSTHQHQQHQQHQPRDRARDGTRDTANTRWDDFVGLYEKPAPPRDKLPRYSRLGRDRHDADLDISRTPTSQMERSAKPAPLNIDEARRRARHGAEAVHGGGCGGDDDELPPPAAERCMFCRRFTGRAKHPVRGRICSTCEKLGFTEGQQRSTNTTTTTTTTATVHATTGTGPGSDQKRQQGGEYLPARANWARSSVHDRPPPAPPQPARYHPGHHQDPGHLHRPTTSSRMAAPSASDLSVYSRHTDGRPWTQHGRETPVVPRAPPPSTGRTGADNGGERSAMFSPDSSWVDDWSERGSRARKHGWGRW